MLQAEQLGINKMKSRHDTNEWDRYRKATIMRKKENVGNTHLGNTKLSKFLTETIQESSHISLVCGCLDLRQPFGLLC
jgi:hypothetical protein